MKKKYLLLIALTAFILPPVLLFWQTNHNPVHKYPTSPSLNNEEMFQQEFSLMTMNAFWGNPNDLLRTVHFLTQKGDRLYAEHWLRYGTLDLQQIETCIAYGDFLMQSPKNKDRARAVFWYRKAFSEIQNRPSFPNRKIFINYLRQKDIQ